MTRLYLDLRPEQQAAERYPAGRGLMASVDTDAECGIGPCCWSCQHFPGDEAECHSKRLTAEDIGNWTIEIRCASYSPTPEA